MAKTHVLKTYPEYFRAVVDGRKTVEIRKNDRGFEVGDVLVLKEFDPTTNDFAGEETSRLITHITEGPWLVEGHVALSIREIPTARINGVDLYDEKCIWISHYDDAYENAIKMLMEGLDTAFQNLPDVECEHCHTEGQIFETARF